MDFGADKRTGTAPGRPPGRTAAMRDPADLRRRDADGHRGQRTPAPCSRGRRRSPKRDLLRLGAENQRYDLDDWWPPSGGGDGPNTFWNINDGQRDRAAAYAEWEAA